MSNLARLRAELKNVDTSGLSTFEKGTLGDARSSLAYQRAGY